MSGAPGMSGVIDADQPPVASSEPVAALTALQRLAQSRERLRQVLAPPPAPEVDDSESGPSWEQRLRAVPGVSFVLDAVQAWWQHHPLRAATTVAREVSRAALRPIAGRHPFALVAVAVAIGAALAWARPWRWALKSALFAGLVPQFASRVASALPIEDWVHVLGSLFTGAGAAAAPDPEHDASAPIATADSAPATPSSSTPTASTAAPSSTTFATAPEPAHAH